VPGPAPAAKLRADAARNRQKVLDAAREVLADRGLDASVEEVARRAAVGVGTIYRRFPDRQALVEAVLEERRQVLTDAMRDAAGDHDDPAVRLRAVATAYAERIAADRALYEAVRSRPQDAPNLAAFKGAITRAFGAVLRPAQEAGAVRADLEPRDLSVLLAAVARIAPPGSPGLWRRELAVVLDGLCPRTPGPLPPLG
jgi:AcrR family transcriptional regulator